MIFHGRPKVSVWTAEELAAAKIKGPRFTVLEDYRVSEIPLIGDVIVPQGFDTDWASIPAFARWWMSGDDPRILVPSLVHDWLYFRSGSFDAYERSLTRQEVDELLRTMMLFCGSSPSRAWTVYQSVRVGGASHWKAAA